MSTDSILFEQVNKAREAWDTARSNLMHRPLGLSHEEYALLVAKESEAYELYYKSSY